MAWAEKNGPSWRGRYKDPQGRNVIAGSAKSRKAALDLAKAEEAKIMGGVWVDPRLGKKTFEDYFLNDWLPNRLVEGRTRDGYLTHYNASIKKTFGHVELRKITPVMVQTWITSLVESGLKPGTVIAKYSVLAATLDAKRGASAVRDGLLGKSPCQKIELPSMVQRDVEIYSPEQLELVVETFEEHEPWWAPLIFVCSETGLRWGEMIGLRPCDISEKYVSVTHTITERKIADTGTGTRFAVKPIPKSGKTRKVAVTPELVRYLRRLALDRRLGQEDQLFGMPDKATGSVLRTPEWPHGLPVSRSHFRDVWKRMVEEAGVPSRRFHDLRATHISWLLAGGADVPSVMRRSGHTQIPTLQRYTQAMEDHDMRALDALKKTKEGKVKKSKKKKRKAA